MNANEKLPNFSRLALIVVLLWLLVVTLIVNYSPGNFLDAGQLGDSFGALNCLFTGLGFAGVYINLRQQAIQLKRQQSEIQSRAQKEIDDKQMSTDQLNALAKQNALLFGNRLIDALNARIVEQYMEIASLPFWGIDRNANVWAITESSFREMKEQCEENLREIDGHALNGILPPEEAIFRRILSRNIELLDAIIICKGTLKQANHAVITKADDFFKAI